MVLLLDLGGQLGRCLDIVARAEGLHRVCQRAASGAASAAELAAALEPVRVLQSRQRTVRLYGSLRVAAVAAVRFFLTNNKKNALLIQPSTVDFTVFSNL